MWCQYGNQCNAEAKYKIKVRKSNGAEVAKTVCKEHRDHYEKVAKANGWEFMEING